jgi:hypothetical protein
MTGLADIVHQWNKVKLYWPHLLWIVLVFNLHIQEWWETYQLQVFTSWRLSTFLFFSLYPVNLFILARILFPLNPKDDESVDLRDFFLANFRKFYLSLMILIVLSIVSNLIVHGFTSDQFLLIFLLIIIGVIAIGNYRSELLHKITALVLFLVFVGSLVVNWNTWLIG